MDPIAKTIESMSDAMKELKNAWVDGIVTLFIVLTVLQGWSWGRVALWIYTPLILLIKVGALTAGRQLMRQVKPKETPRPSSITGCMLQM